MSQVCSFSTWYVECTRTADTLVPLATCEMAIIFRFAKNGAQKIVFVNKISAVRVRSTNTGLELSMRIEHRAAVTVAHRHHTTQFFFN